MADNFEVFWYEMRFGKKHKVVKGGLTKEKAEQVKDAVEYEGFKAKVQKEK